MANLSEDRVALTIGRLTLRIMILEQELDELRGMYKQAVSDYVDDMEERRTELATQES